MANIPENVSPTWAAVPILDEDTLVLGGPDGPSNAQAKALSERTDYLRKVMDEVVPTAAYVANITALRELSKTGSQNAFIQGYYAAGDGGSGLYWIDPTDTTSPDNGGTVIVAEDGGRWKLQVEGVVTVTQFGAKGDNLRDDTQAIQAALNTGGTVLAPAGQYRVSALLYTTKNGQEFIGDGIERTVIKNDINNAPMFCFGNPTEPDGATQWAAVEGMSFIGNSAGTTRWGVFVPNAPAVDGAPNTAGRYEGMSNSANNYYFGQLPFVPAEWTIAARGCSLRNVRIEQITGGYALHVSAWGFKADNVQLFSSLRGLRNAGASNSNNYEDLYISSMTYEGITHPDTPSSIPTACSYVNCVVQQCGVDAGGKGSVALYKGQGTLFTGLYLERNNERGGLVDVFVGVSEIGCVFDTVRHRADTTTPLQTVIQTEGAGTRVGTVVYAVSLREVVRITGTDVRTQTVIYGPIMPVGSPTLTNGSINDQSAGKRVAAFLPEDPAWGVSLNSTHRMYRSTGKFALSSTNGAGTTLTLESQGGMSFSTDTGNVTTGGDFTWNHNGLVGAGTPLLTLKTSNGNLFGGSDNTQNLGNGSARWAAVYAGTGTINTSDEREKQDIEVLSAAELRVAAVLKRSIKKYRFKDAVAEKGEEARTHVGVIAQEVMAAFQAEGLDPMRYGVICYDEWDESPEGVPAGNRYGVRYDELVAFIIAGL